MTSTTPATTAVAKEPAKVLVVEDNLEAQKSICALLESAQLTVQTFSSGKEFLEAYNNQAASCMVLDIRLPDISGLQVLERLHGMSDYQPPTIMITAFGDVSTAVAAMKCKILDFLEKPFPPQRLLDLVQQAVEIHQVARERYEQRQTLQKAMVSLSDREQTILKYLISGKPNKQIATELSLSHKTIASHRANILKKLGADNLIEVIRLLER
jgi:two-component system response regulator FixJ